MIPPKSDPRWKDLLTGRCRHQFKLASAAMCVARNQRHVIQDSSPQMIEKCVDEIHTFFSKFESIAAEDLDAIFELERSRTC